LWTIAYAIMTAACLGTAAEATYRIHTLDSSASWIDLQLGSEESNYEATLQSRYVDQELQSFSERHIVIAASAAWWQIRLGLLMFWVVASFAFYVFRVVTSFSEELSSGMAQPALDASAGAGVAAR
jgi:hypothetical protein